MRKNPSKPWPEVFVSDASTTRAVSKAVQEGQLRKLASRLYTRNLSEEPEKLVRRYLWDIVAGYFPGALVADRTALEMKPAPDGSVCLITEHSEKDIALPGILLRPRHGTPPLSGDRPFMSGLFVCSVPRAYLENMRVSRTGKGKLPRTLPQEELQSRLEEYLRSGGPNDINRLRDEIRQTATELGMETQAVRLDEIIGTLLGTRTAALASPSAQARAAGFDAGRVARFEVLFEALRNRAPVLRSDTASSPIETTNIAFFEAYFSNFIEGTKFQVAEAADIVFQGNIPPQRPRDAHDIMGTFRIVSDTPTLKQPLTNSGVFLDVLRHRHAIVMGGRPDKHPGWFKTLNNQAGDSVFVEPGLVEGTLVRGFDMLQGLENAFDRALAMMFLVSEVHPFDDGNGRMARIMMNAELVAADEQRIIIPTVYRTNYLVALKALTHNNDPVPFIRVMDFAQRWTAAIGWQNFDQALKRIQASHAFIESAIADEEGLRLTIPLE